MTQLSLYGNLSNYSSALNKSGSTISNPHIYATINNKPNKASFIINSTSNTYQFNLQTNSFVINSTENYTNQGMQDLVFLDEALIYRDSTRTYIYIIDRKSLLGQFNAKYNNYVLNFDVILKPNATTSMYQVFACSDNSSASDNQCSLYEINAAVSPVSVAIKFNQSIGNMCADSVRIVREFVVIACWSYKNNAGRLDIYGINSNNTMTQIQSISCNYSECYLGQQVVINDLKSEHIQVYYTLFNQDTSTQVNMIDIMRLYYSGDGQFYFVKNASNNFISIDNTIGRNLTFGMYSSTMILKYIQLSTVLQTPVCSFTQQLNGSQCFSCSSGQVNVHPNTGGLCEQCGTDPGSYGYSSFENILKTDYCPNYPSFSPSMLVSNNSQVVITPPANITNNNTSTFITYSSSSNSLKDWQIALIVVLPSLFLIIIIGLLYWFCCRKDMKKARNKEMQAVSKIDEDENIKTQNRKEQYQVQSQAQDMTIDQQYPTTPEKVFKNRFDNQVLYSESPGDEEDRLNNNKNQNSNRKDIQNLQNVSNDESCDIEVLSGSLSFNNGVSSIQKPSPLKVIRQYENKYNFPIEDNDILKQVQPSINDPIIFHIESQQSDQPIEINETNVSQTLYQKANSFRYRSTITKNPTLIRGNSECINQQLFETFRTSPRKELKDLISEDPIQIEASSCILCFNFFKLSDSIFMLEQCQKRVKHLAHSDCIERAIQQNIIQDFVCQICKANNSFEVATQASPFEEQNFRSLNQDRQSQSMKRQLEFDD